MFKSFIITLTILSSSLVAFAQQDAMYTHYAFNTLSVNPAYAGSRGVATVTALHRSQWVGFKGAPTTQTLTFHSPLAGESFGIGLSVVNDEIGPLNLLSTYADLSYRLKVTQDVKLGFGIKLGGNFVKGDLSALETTVGNDNVLVNLENKFLFNSGVGIYLSGTRWYTGISAPKLLETDYLNTSTASLSTSRKHFFFIAGFVTDLGKNVKLKPTTFVKATKASPIELDLTAMLIFKDKLELGVMGRTGDAIGALIGYNFTENMRAGYSFDWSFENNTAKYNSGSHEVMFRYDFINKGTKRIKSPRFF